MEIPKGLFSLNKWDWLYGALNAVSAAVIFAIGTYIAQDSFSVFQIDWEIVINAAVKAGMAALVGHLGTSTITDNRGDVLGVLPTR